MALSLFVHLKTRIAVLYIIDDLPCCGQSGVDVGLGRLGTHLLGRGEETLAEERGELLLRVGGYVGYVLQIGALREGGLKSFLVDNLLARRIDQRGTLGHRHQKVVSD